MSEKVNILTKAELLRQLATATQEDCYKAIPEEILPMAIKADTHTMQHLFGSIDEEMANCFLIELGHHLRRIITIGLSEARL